MQPPSSLERVIRRDRLLMALGLAATIVLAWVYLVRAAAGMQAMATEAQMHAAMGMADMRAWGLADWFGLFMMWAIMMIAMMLPSAAPVILLVLGMYRQRVEPQARLAAAAFVAGYLVAWTVFSVAASAAQVALHRAALLAPDMRSSSSALSGAILILAGVYQWLPVKNTCLSHCHSPLGFLSQHWREGTTGGLFLGLRHGAFCVGCCWLLMMLLFVVGVMNLLWVAVLAAFVLIERLFDRRALLARAAGMAVAAWGIFLLVSAYSRA
jgi:predicted metal-binding membrane protein